MNHPQQLFDTDYADWIEGRWKSLNFKNKLLRIGAIVAILAISTMLSFGYFVAIF